MTSMLLYTVEIQQDDGDWEVIFNSLNYHEAIEKWKEQINDRTPARLTTPIWED